MGGQLTGSEVPAAMKGWTLRELYLAENLTHGYRITVNDGANGCASPHPDHAVPWKLACLPRLWLLHRPVSHACAPACAGWAPAEWTAGLSMPVHV